MKCSRSFPNLFLKNLFFPIFCVECGLEGCFLCGPCREKIAYQKNPWQENKPSESMAKTFAPLIYCENNLTAQLIQLFKYQFAHEVWGTLLNLISTPLLQNKHYFQNSLFVPVPLHKKRQRWRGFNQAEMIATDLGKILELPVSSLLERTRNTPPQAELSAKERRKNVRDAFELKKLPDKIPQKIFLVDDVVSTGSTLSECGKALQKYLDIEVNGLVLAAPREHGASEPIK